MRRNKHLLLWSSLGCLVLLLIAAYQEHVLQDWRQIQRQYRQVLPTKSSDQFEIRLRQVVVPALRRADRCVSCHVGMAPGEKSIPGHRVFGPHSPVVHDPLEFGCTVCHGGQGRATQTRDAHGDVLFWPEPMIPLRQAEAGCGTCHTHLSVPDRRQLRAGRSRLERYDCLNCHALDGRGGTIRPLADDSALGPDLSLIGHTGYRPDWYEGHITTHRQAVSGIWKDSFSAIPSEEFQALKGFLDSRVGAPDLVEAKSLFHSLGCRGCHAVHGVGGDDGPDLSGVGQTDPGQLDFSHVSGSRSLLNWWTEHFRAPAKLVPGSLMPAVVLTEEENASLNLYLLSLRRSSFPEAYWPLDRIRSAYFGEREFRPDGATLYGTFCAACHGQRGEGRRYSGTASFPALNNPVFLRLASDSFLEETIRRGRPGRRMPAWGAHAGGLEPPEIQALIRYIRELGDGVMPQDEEPPRWIQPTQQPGDSLYRIHCSGCHGLAGEGADGPALANPVLLSSAGDRYLLETILQGRPGTSMPAFASASPVHAALDESEIESLVAFIRTWEKSE